jgi:hypothetical protein
VNDHFKVTAKHITIGRSTVATFESCATMSAIRDYRYLVRIMDVFGIGNDDRSRNSYRQFRMLLALITCSIMREREKENSRYSFHQNKYITIPSNGLPSSNYDEDATAFHPAATPPTMNNTTNA